MRSTEMSSQHAKKDVHAIIGYAVIVFMLLYAYEYHIPAREASCLVRHALADAAGLRLRLPYLYAIFLIDDRDARFCMLAAQAHNLQVASLQQRSLTHLFVHLIASSDGTCGQEAETAYP